MDPVFLRFAARLMGAAERLNDRKKTKKMQWT